MSTMNTTSVNTSSVELTEIPELSLTWVSTNKNIYYSTSQGVTHSNGKATVLATVLQPETKYNVLGKEIEVSGHNNFTIGICLALINLHGISFYLEIKKQQITFPNKIEEYLESELVSYLRSQKIDKVIN